MMSRASDIEMTAARRAYKAGLGVSEWEACLLPHEIFDLMRAYKAERDALVGAAEQAAEYMQMNDRLYSAEEREVYDALCAAIAAARAT